MACSAAGNWDMTISAQRETAIRSFGACALVGAQVVRRGIGPVALLFLSACAVQRVATLAPTNTVASVNGVVTGHFVAHGTGNGEASLNLPTGEVLTGEYQIDRSPVFGFGDIIVAALTKQGAAAIAAEVGDYQEVSPGEVTVASPGGKSARCEFYNNNISGHGGGACRLWNGATYELQY